MPTITYEDVNPVIENTTMEVMIVDGRPHMYNITPIAGYVIHDKAGDIFDIDPITGEETVKAGFCSGSCSCLVSYDFEENPREFYTVPASEVPPDQIYGDVNNEHEAM